MELPQGGGSKFLAVSPIFFSKSVLLYSYYLPLNIRICSRSQNEQKTIRPCIQGLCPDKLVAQLIVKIVQLGFS